MGSNVFLLLADLTPFVSRFVTTLDKAVASNEQKRKAVLDLVGYLVLLLVAREME